MYEVYFQNQFDDYMNENVDSGLSWSPHHSTSLQHSLPDEPQEQPVTSVNGFPRPTISKLLQFVQKKVSDISYKVGVETTVMDLKSPSSSTNIELKLISSGTRSQLKSKAWNKIPVLDLGEARKYTLSSTSSEQGLTTLTSAFATIKLTHGDWKLTNHPFSVDFHEECKLSGPSFGESGRDGLYALIIIVYSTDGVKTNREYGLMPFTVSPRSKNSNGNKRDVGQTVTAQYVQSLGYHLFDVSNL